MKKIISALLVFAVVGSSNASIEGVKTHAKNHWPKYAITAGTLAAAGTAVFCDYKYNDSDYLNKVKALVAANKRNVAIGSAIIAGLTGLGTAGYYGHKNDVHGAIGRKATGAYGSAKTGVTNGVTYVKNSVKGLFINQAKVELVAVKAELDAVTTDRDLLQAGLDEEILNSEATAVDLRTANARITDLNATIVVLNTAKTNLEVLLEEAQDNTAAQDAPVEEVVPAEEVENNEDNN